MLTRTEKTYLALTLVFLAAGSGLQAWRRASVELGPFRAAATAPDTAGMREEDAGGPGPSGPGPDSGREAGGANAPAAGFPGANARSGDAGPSSHTDTSGAGRVTGGHAASGSAGPERIELNRADLAGLMRIKGIGAKTAEAILAHRRTHGPFRSLRDLLRIKGIGEKKLEKLAPHIIL